MNKKLYTAMKKVHNLPASLLSRFKGYVAFAQGASNWFLVYQ
jgi:hypothetical protein